MDYYGKYYGCSPKKISEYIVENYPEWEVVWGFVNPEKFNIKGIKKTKYYSFDFFFQLITSKVIVTNYRMPEFFLKRKCQRYIQTWHSSIRLKKIEKDAEEKLTPGYIKMAQKDSKNIDLILSGCKKSSFTFKNSFWYDGEILEVGTPRLDSIINPINIDPENAKRKLNLNESSKIILYCPTFRQNIEDKSYYLEVSDFYELLSSSVQNSNWKILVRFHPHENYRKEEINNHPDIINVSNYDDVQELMIISDFLITDYSSLMFDFAYTCKPCLLYVPDLGLYQNKERELYFNIHNLPFPLAGDKDELIDKIKNFKTEEYKVSLNDFFNLVGSFETGNASKKVAEYISKWIK